jgi:flavin reductase (DIM6/NTAB) family NADH-FMN oxidoreductase RutF
MTAESTLSPAILREAFGRYPSGVTALCGLVDGIPVGLTASSFTSVSLEPPLVSVCIARTSTTWPAMRHLPSFGISVLSNDQGPLARAMSARGTDRFSGVDWLAAETGAVFVHGSTLWLECDLESLVAAGDHFIAIFEVTHLESYPDIAPIVFHASQFHSLVTQ